jgi:hypothetical protein
MLMEQMLKVVSFDSYSQKTAMFSGGDRNDICHVFQ